MPRALDHLVLPTRNLAGLVARFRSAGFKVGSRNRHPWGTENHIIQFDGSFLELIGLADDYVPLPDVDPAAPFGGFIARWLDRTPDGIGMAVLRSDDAAADAELFRAAGIGRGRMLPFSRQSRRTDGIDKVVAFTIAFAEAASMPELGFFVCEQHRPENFWDPAQQVHDNAITAIGGLVIAAARPDDHRAFLAAFAASAGFVPIEGGYVVPLERGRIEVVTPQRFTEAYGQQVSVGDAETCIAAILLESKASTVGNMHGRTVLPVTETIALVIEPPSDRSLA